MCGMQLDSVGASFVHHLRGIGEPLYYIFDFFDRQGSRRLEVATHGVKGAGSSRP